ncbi:MAG: PEP-CTERM sorting domain-containing protein [Planctomycetota bacterium]|nr:PEP-CTERM sorting domain-containing protein [Planctomycetota bacterium]
MRCKLRSAVIAIGSAALLISLPRHASAQVQVTSGQGVTFQQLDFNFDNTSPDVSNTGQISADYSQLSAATGITNGYLNVVNGSGWAVQNVPVNTNLSHMDTTFNLNTPDGTTDTSTSEQVFYSATPLASAPSASPTNFSVTADPYNAQGEGANRGNPAAPPPSGVVSFNTLGLTKTAIEIGVPNVNAADNQCAPAAIANGLAYLKTTYGLLIPDANVPGRGAFAGTLKNPSQPTGATYAGNTLLVPTPPAPLGPNSSTQTFSPAPSATPFKPGTPLPYGNYTTNEVAGSSLVGQMDLLMGRSSQNRAEYFDQVATPNSPGPGTTYTVQDTNAGVNGTNQLKGMEQYLVNNNDANIVQVQYQNYNTGTFGNTVTDPGVAGIAAPQDVSAQGTNYIFNQIMAGNMVKVGYRGHATIAVAAGYILGAPWVVLQSDLQQTPQNDSTDSIIGNNGTLGQYGLEFGFLVNNAGINGGALSLYGVSGTPQIINDISVAVVPEPVSVGLLVLGGLGLMSRRHRRRPEMRRLVA